MKNAIRLSERDNVAVLLEPLKAKEQLIYMDEAAALHSCTVMENIPIYHKAALCDIQAGERIMKYGGCMSMYTMLPEAAHRRERHNEIFGLSKK